MDDLRQHNIELAEGMRMTLYMEDIEADGVVAYSEAEACWVAIIDWNAIRDI